MMIVLIALKNPFALIGRICCHCGVVLDGWVADSPSLGRRVALRLAHNCRSRSSSDWSGGLCSTLLLGGFVVAIVCFHYINITIYNSSNYYKLYISQWLNKEQQQNCIRALQNLRKYITHTSIDTIRETKNALSLANAPFAESHPWLLLILRNRLCIK